MLSELRDRLAEITKTRDRLQGLLNAVVAVGAGLELEESLQRIVQTAVDLAAAGYGALGVFGDEGLRDPCADTRQHGDVTGQLGPWLRSH